MDDQYIQKLAAQCKDADNVFWENQGDTCFQLSRVWDGEFIPSPVEGRESEQSLELSIDRRGFTIRLEGGDSFFGLEQWNDRETVSKEAGVSFPEYKMVNCICYSGAQDTYGCYYLMLDKKPSKAFIREIECSLKWKKREDGKYVCEYGTSNSVGQSIMVDKNSRVVVAKDGV